MNKLLEWKEHHFDVIYVADDWKGKPNWIQYKKDLAQKGRDVIYFPYTHGTSSTLLSETLRNLKKESI